MALIRSDAPIATTSWTIPGMLDGGCRAAQLASASATKSARAAGMLKDWGIFLPLFVRVMPNDYRRVLEAQARMREKGMSEDEAVMAAFTENARAYTRASGS